MRDYHVTLRVEGSAEIKCLKGGKAENINQMLDRLLATWRTKYPNSEPSRESVSDNATIAYIDFGSGVKVVVQDWSARTTIARAVINAFS